jgi:hypothetical protein
MEKPAEDLLSSDQNPPLLETPSYAEIDETIGDPYCFESDHVALKGNVDYQNLLRTMVMLEAQRAKGLQDLEKLHDEQEKVKNELTTASQPPPPPLPPPIPLKQ